MKKCNFRYKSLLSDEDLCYLGGSNPAPCDEEENCILWKIYNKLK